MPRALALSAALFLLAASAQTPAPHLERRGSATQLIVDGKPFLMLAGEIHNNAATSLDYMRPIWGRLKALHVNTALVPISWALLEPTEGRFDYTLVDGLIREARTRQMRLVFLWFGSWKNTWSSYAPEWVKRDFERFPRVVLRNGMGTERLSPFSAACREADSKAFAALMRRIRELDSQEHTVLMVQVENEVGVIPDARDHSPAANAAYEAAVPAELTAYLSTHKDDLDTTLRARWRAAGARSSGNWEAVFGAGAETEDLFMAWHYAKYMGSVAAAGKKEYLLPMFTNAALIRPSYAPGQYNSGGPLPHSLDLWRAAAPQLDFHTPDIYFEFKKWAAAYDRPGNPLFIPEAMGGAAGAANAYYAIGAHKALGFSPFAVEAMDQQDTFSQAYSVLNQLAPMILEAQAQGRIAASVLEELTPSQNLTLGGYTLRLTPFAPRRPGPGIPPEPGAAATERPHGLFIQAGPDEFYMTGAGLNIAFTPLTAGPPIAGLATVEEGVFVDGRWQRGRTLAGDDTGQGNNVTLRAVPIILRVRLYRYR